MTQPTPTGLLTPLEHNLGGAIAAYDSYVWMLHTHDFPDDLEAAERGLEIDPEQARFDAEAWGSAEPQTVSRRLANQLNFALRRVIVVAEAPRNYELAEQQGVNTVVQTCLTDLIGTLVMDQINQEEWSPKNHKLALLENPFSNTRLLEFLWNTQWRRSTRIPANKNVPGIEVIAPGYYSL